MPISHSSQIFRFFLCDNLKELDKLRNTDKSLKVSRNKNKCVKEVLERLMIWSIENQNIFSVTRLTTIL